MLSHSFVPFQSHAHTLSLLSYYRTCATRVHFQRSNVLTWFCGQRFCGTWEIMTTVANVVVANSFLLVALAIVSLSRSFFALISFKMQMNFREVIIKMHTHTHWCTFIHISLVSSRSSHEMCWIEYMYKYNRTASSASFCLRKKMHI